MHPSLHLRLALLQALHRWPGFSRRQGFDWSCPVRGFVVQWALAQRRQGHQWVRLGLFSLFGRLVAAWSWSWS
ncbi:hypothetical protein BDW74DRAFT_162471 [Aspergillus multicolor]|uniref:uncharacterized protein n=1 Tax=Aspergillus multicolor TaxID=41759 RepID=UPI003CCD4EFB